MTDSDIIHLEKMLDDFSKSFGPDADKKLPANILKFAEELLNDKSASHVPQKLWHKYLDVTRHSGFLKALREREKRYRWAETVFKSIRVSHYTLTKLLEQRVEAHPEKPLFITYDGEAKNEYTYRWVDSRLKKLQPHFYM